MGCYTLSVAENEDANVKMYFDLTSENQVQTGGILMANFEQWDGFAGRNWRDSVDVRAFIQENYTMYDGDESFLEGPTKATDKLWGRLQELQKEERAKGGVLDMETEVVSGLTAYGPGYIDEDMKELE